MGAHRVYRRHKYAFGKQVLILRTRTALTQIALAEQIGVHRRSVQNWETGQAFPKADMLQRLIAVFLRHHAFTPGAERAEAISLWEQAAQDGPYPLPFFDEVWFARMLALHTRVPAPNDREQEPGLGSAPPAPAKPNTLRTFIDRGEAIAVPALYGRERELATLRQWIADDNCRMIAILGLGGIGKSSLVVTIAHQVADQFDVVLFRSLQNGPPLAELLDQTICTVSDQQRTPPDRVADKIALLVQLFRERRCLFILDNFESLLQPAALAGTYRTGYAEYTEFLQSLSTRAHQSCVLVTSREKLAELGSFADRTGPVRTLPLFGLPDSVCQTILETKDIHGTMTEVQALAHLYGGNPLALMLVAEPIRDLFGGDLGTFLVAGGSSFNGIGTLLEQQVARSTPLEQALLYALAIERELVPINVLLAKMSSTVLQRDALVALKSLRRRLLIEQAVDQPALTLQPVILEFLTDQLVESVYQEIATGQPRLLLSHAFIQTSAKDYVRRSQERLIATPLLQRLGNPDAIERQLLNLISSWRNQPPLVQGYGPGNVINLLRLLRGHLRGFDLTGLAIRQAYFQDVEMHDTSLARASVRDSVFTEAFGIIHAVAASPDGSYWAASSINGTIQVWRDDGRTAHLSIPAHTKQAVAVAFSPDGRTLASGSWDCTIKLWSISNGALLGTLNGHSDYVQSIVFAPDGHLLASASDDKTVRLWDVASGACLQTLHAHGDNAYGVAWSPGGEWIVSCGFDQMIRVWDVASGACVQILEGHTDRVTKLAFSPDGQLLASGGFDRTVKIWEIATGYCLQTFAEHTSTVTAVAWSPDGHTIASSSYDATIRLWDVNYTAAQQILRGHSASINSVTFTADGSMLLSGSSDRTVRVWDVQSGRSVRVIQGYGVFFFAVAWSPEGQRLLSANSDANLTLWSAVDGMALQTLRGHTHTVYAAAWSPDGQWLASGGYDQTIRIWDATTGVCVRIIQAHTDIVFRVAWNPDSRSLASVSRDQTVRVWDVVSGACRWVGRAHTGPINEVVWSPDGQRLASCGEDHTLRLWQAEDGTLLQTLAGHASSVAGVAWSPDGRQLASCGGGGTAGELLLWDAESGKQLHSFHGHASVVFRVAWSQDGKILLSGGINGTIRWWDVASAANLQTRQGHRGWIRSLSVSPDGSTLASSGEDGLIQLWDMQRAEIIRTLRLDRPYERMDITGLNGITEAQYASLVALGAIDGRGAGRETRGANAPSSNAVALAAEAGQPARSDRKAALTLPLQPTPLLGRDAELAEITHILSDPAGRLLTLVGPGGIGKTRLALAVAAAHTASFPDGVAFVALASVGTRDQIVSAIGDRLGLSFAGHVDPTAHLLSELRTRQILLVLDNFEHLLDATELVSAILADAPGITLLITSRERLNIQAEWLFDVDGLSYPSADQPGSVTVQHLADLTSYSAVQLFVQRARQVQPRMSLSESVLATIVRICQQVAGMPLAIELAAASLHTLPLAAIERQIGASLDVLATTRRDLPARHRSMRAVFDHSWQLLREEERALISHLAVFRGGWTVEAAVEVAGATLPALSALVDKSLVRPDNVEPHSAAEHTGPNVVEQPRYVMLESIRQYALEQLTARGEAEALQCAHATYYVVLAETIAEQWDTPMLNAAIAQQRREHDNIRAALQWACEMGDARLGLRLAHALWGFWRSYGYSSEGRTWFQQLLRLDEHPTDAAAMVARQRGLHAAAWLASDQHDYAYAARLFEESMALRRPLGEAEGKTDLLINAAREARAVGQYQRATALLEDALARHRSLNDRGSPSGARLGLSFHQLGQVLRELALVLRERGDFTRAIGLLDESLALYRASSDRVSVALALLGLGDVARDQGDGAGVREYCEPSLAIFRESGMQWAIGFVLNNLALGAYYEGNQARALALIAESVALFRGLKANASLAEVLITLGKIARARGDAAAAYAALTEALRLAVALGPRLMMAAALEELANVVILQGDAELAVRLLAAALALRAQMGTAIRPADQAFVEQTLATAQTILGAGVFAAVWAQAQALPLKQLLSTFPGTAAFSGLHEESA